MDILKVKSQENSSRVLNQVFAFGTAVFFILNTISMPVFAETQLLLDGSQRVQAVVPVDQVNNQTPALAPVPKDLSEAGPLSAPIVESKKAVKPPTREQQIANFYMDYLGRAGSEQEIKNWAKSTLKIEAIKQAFLQSQERSNLVAGYYQNYLGRNGSAAEIKAWAYQDIKIPDLKNGFLQSQERSNLVASYYRDYLGRDGSVAEIQAWAFQDKKIQDIKTSILTSDERKTKIADYHVSFIGRTASEQEVLNYAKQDKKLTDIKEEILVLGGWTRAASNVNFAYRSRQISGYKVFELMDLVSGTTQEIDRVGSSTFTSYTSFADVSADGKYVVFEICKTGPNNGGDYQIKIKDLATGVIKTTAVEKGGSWADMGAVNPAVDSVVFSVGQIVITRQHTYELSDTVLKYVYTMDVASGAVSAAAVSVVHADAVYLHDFSDLGVLVQEEYFEVQPQVLVYRQKAPGVYELIGTYGISSTSSSVPAQFPFLSGYQATNGQKFISVSATAAGGSAATRIINADTGASLYISSGAASAVTYSGNIASYTVEKNGVSQIVNVDLNTLKVVTLSPVLPVGVFQAGGCVMADYSSSATSTSCVGTIGTASGNREVHVYNQRGNIGITIYDTANGTSQSFSIQGLGGISAENFTLDGSYLAVSSSINRVTVIALGNMQLLGTLYLDVWPGSEPHGTPTIDNIHSLGANQFSIHTNDSQVPTVVPLGRTFNLTIPANNRLDLSSGLPDGWVRSASNANFAFQIAYQGSLAKLMVMNLVTGTQQQVAMADHSGSYPQDFDSKMDIDPAGVVVIYGITQYPYGTASFVQNLDNASQQVSMSNAHITSIVYETGGNVLISAVSDAIPFAGAPKQYRVHYGQGIAPTFLPVYNPGAVPVLAVGQFQEGGCLIQDFNTGVSSTACAGFVGTPNGTVEVHTYNERGNTGVTIYDSHQQKILNYSVASMMSAITQSSISPDGKYLTVVGQLNQISVLSLVVPASQQLVSIPQAAGLGAPIVDQAKFISATRILVTMKDDSNRQFYVDIVSNQPLKLTLAGWDFNHDGKLDAWDTTGKGKPNVWDLNFDGKSDAYDTTGKGKPNVWDRDFNGSIDAWDTSGRGVPNMWDTNRDGKADAYDTTGSGRPNMWDRDYNGKVDAWDTTGSGKPNMWDMSGSGKPDAFDLNGDGIIDWPSKYRGKIPRPPVAVKK